MPLKVYYVNEVNSVSYHKIEPGDCPYWNAFEARFTIPYVVVVVVVFAPFPASQVAGGQSPLGGLVRRTSAAGLAVLTPLVGGTRGLQV